MSEARTLNPRVIVRPATRNVFTAVPFTASKKRRVAAYARVSTDSDEQYTSYVAQVDYYMSSMRNRISPRCNAAASYPCGTNIKT